MTKASESRKARRRSKVVPIKTKKGLRLTQMERVRMDNCLLRLRVIQNEAQSRVAIVNKEKIELMAAIGKRLKIPLDAYQINLDDGSVTPLRNAEADADEETTQTEAS